MHLITISLILLSPWILLLISGFGRYSENKTIKAISSAIFYSLFLIVFWTLALAEGYDEIEHALAILPLAIFVAPSLLAEFLNFIIIPTILSLVCGVSFFLAIWKRYKINTFIIAQFFTLACFLFLASIYQHVSMSLSSKNLNLDCYVIQNSFLEAVLQSASRTITHAEGYKNDTPYLWSYKKNAFVPIDKNKSLELHFISKEKCINLKSLSPVS